MTDQFSRKIIMVYNADKGLVKGLMDSVHKLVSPETYECALCTITHGFAGQKKQWKDFTASLNIPIVFYHKNDVPLDYTEFKFPVILLENSSGIQPIMNRSEITEFSNINDFIVALDEKLSKQ